MCFHEFYRSKACGHHFPKVQHPVKTTHPAFFDDPYPSICVPQSLTCIPVKLALKFYHDQVVYLPADMNCGSKVEIPRTCPIVHSHPRGTSVEVMNVATMGQWAADIDLRYKMFRNGLEPPQERQILHDASIVDQCSNRAKPGDHIPSELRRHKRRAYPLNMFAHVQELRVHQQRDRSLMTPNVIYIDVDFGCGGPFSEQCLRGWDSIQLLTHRLHLWGDGTTHPRPCNNECLAGWSGRDLDAHRRQTWSSGAVPVGWKDTNDYATSAHDFLSKRTLHAGQPWIALDYSNISHRHADQWRWDGSKLVSIDQILSEDELKLVKVPEHVSLPVPNRLYQILSNMPPKASSSNQPNLVSSNNKPKDESKPPPPETPEMAEKRTRKEWDKIRARISRDHSSGKNNAVVEAQG